MILDRLKGIVRYHDWRDHIIVDAASLLLVDATETDDPALDLILKRIAEEQDQRNVQY